MPNSVIYGTTGMLMLALAPMPYGYYTLLRLVSTVVFAWAAFTSAHRRHSNLPWVFGLLAIAFNPVLKVPLEREIWSAIDVGSAVLLIATRSQLKSGAPSA